MSNGITRRTSLIMGAAAAATFTGLRSQLAHAQPAAELRIAYGSLGSTLHPHSVSNLANADLANLLYDPLVTRNDKGEIQFVLAETLEQEASGNIKIKLRDGARFHDGRPVTVEDVKFSIENYLAPATLNKYMYSDWLERVDIVDKSNVVIVSKKPYRVAIPNMGYLSHIIPAGSKPEDFAHKPVGSGPYRFVEYVPNNRLVVERNEDYWGEKPPTRRLVLRQIPENATRVAALEAGEVDFVNGITVDDVERLRGQGLKIGTSTTYRTLFIRFNHKTDSPVKDVRVRRALNHAVDRAALREAFLGSLGKDSTSPVAHTLKYAATGLAPYEYDLDKAKGLLKEAGFASGFSATMVTTTGRYAKDREIAEAIGGQLEQIGVRLQLVPLEYATYLQQVRGERETTGKKYALGLLGWGNLNADIDFSLAPFDAKNSAWNLNDYNNPRAQELIEKGRGPGSEAELAAIYAEAQKLIWGDAPWLFLFELPNVDAMVPSLEGWVGRADEQIRWVNFKKGA